MFLREVFDETFQAGPAQGGAVELTPAGRALVSGAWSWASWYQGNVLAGLRPAMLGLLPSTGDAEAAKTMLWAARIWPSSVWAWAFARMACTPWCT